MNEQDAASVAWSRDAQKRGILIWISFLVACVMSVVFFALVDPQLIVEDLSVGLADSREAGYAVMFFFLWVTALVTGWLCLRLARRKRNWPKPVGAGTNLNEH
ncbi:MAG: hypothetical protein AAFZ58_14415 [Pseudomonadota bacterium]